MKVSGPKIKKFLIISNISGNWNFKRNFLFLGEMESSSLKLPSAFLGPISKNEKKKQS